MSMEATNRKLQQALQRIKKPRQSRKLSAIFWINEKGKTQIPIFHIDDGHIDDVFKNIVKLKDELREPVIHSLKSRDGIKSIEMDVLSALMHTGEAKLWSQRAPKNESDNTFEIFKVVTNYRVFVYDHEEDIMLKYVDLADIDDVVVVDRHVDSKSKGTTYFVGGYGDHLLGGIAPTNTSTYSNSIGDVVFMRLGKPYVILNQLPDPDGVVTMVKSVMKELYPRN